MYLFKKLKSKQVPYRVPAGAPIPASTGINSAPPPEDPEDSAATETKGQIEVAVDLNRAKGPEKPEYDSSADNRQAPEMDLATYLASIPDRSRNVIKSKPPLEASRRVHKSNDAKLPTFSTLPPEVATLPSDASDRDKVSSLAKLSDAFTPTKPKLWSKNFSGRYDALRRVISAIEEEQAHVILHGARGIGKTSLVNILAEAAGQADYQVRRISWSSETSFEDLFRRILRDLPASFMDRSAQKNNPSVENLEQLLPRGSFGPMEVTEAMALIRLEHVIIVIDEFDRVMDERTKNKVAETIKNISDIPIRVTFIIIGIAENLEELIGLHPSIQRHVIGVHLPLMEQAELCALIRTGELNSGIRVDDSVRDLIASFSKGLPYYVQLICLHAGRRAINRGSSSIELDDLRHALRNLLNNADPVMVASYQMATRGDRNIFMMDVLYAAAAATYGRFGEFTVPDAARALVLHGGPEISELRFHNALTTLTLDRNGAVVTKHRAPSGSIEYRFKNPTMRHYILLRQASLRQLL